MLFSSTKIKHPVFSTTDTGVLVSWTPGSVWDTYPYQLHAYHCLGWEPVSFLKATNQLHLRADSCTNMCSIDDQPCGEKAMGIQEQDTVDYREKFAIPDSDGLEPEERTPVSKRSRSDTTSTVHSQDIYTHHHSGKRLD